MTSMSDPRLDITSLIMDDHEWFRRQFARLDDAADNDELAAIWAPLATRLDTHAQAEETIFYPACRALRDEDARRIVGESMEEHTIVKRLIKELAPLDGSDERFQAKATVLKESVEHHAGEEESDLFPVAESELGEERLRALGRKMESLKSRRSSGKRAGIAGKRAGAARTSARKRR